MLSQHPKRMLMIGFSLLGFCLTSSLYLSTVLVSLGFLSYASIIVDTMRQQQTNERRQQAHPSSPQTQNPPKPKKMLRFSSKNAATGVKGHLRPVTKASTTKTPARVKI